MACLDCDYPPLTDADVPDDAYGWEPPIFGPPTREDGWWWLEKVVAAGYPPPRRDPPQMDGQLNILDAG